MQFIDLKKQYSILKEQIDENIHSVLEHGQYIMGPEIVKLEKKLADYTGRKYCATCSSGTDALLIPLLAWDIGQGDAVFTTPFTFIATAEVISLVGATPVFVDIDEKTYNISPELLEEKIIQIENHSNLKPKAIIPVDLFGLPSDYAQILKIAEKHNLKVLEDAAQAFGGSTNGLKACKFGEISATSFFPAKPLGCYGDGGAIFTDNSELYEKITSIRVHGQGQDKYTNVRIGVNGRIDSIQAAVLLAKLLIFDDEIKMRNSIASKYNEKLKDKLVVPSIPDGYISAWAQYSVLAENSRHRSEIQARLKEKNIPTAIYYPIPLHLQEAFGDLGQKKGDFPISERISERIFSLPFHPYLSDEDIELICGEI